MRNGGRAIRVVGVPSPVRAPGADDYVVPLIVLGLCAAFGYFLYQLWSEEKIIQFWAYGAGAVFVLIVGALVAWKLDLFKGKEEDAKYYDPDQVSIRISGSAFQFEVHTMVFLGQGETQSRNRAVQLLNTVNGVYRGFDNPLGCRFEVEDIRELRTIDAEKDKLPKQGDKWDVRPEKLLVFASEARRYGMFRKPRTVGVIGVKEIVAFWHIPGAGVDVQELARVQSRILPPPLAVLEGGALVGTSRDVDVGWRGVYFPIDVMGRHQLFVARTRQGKSTLMCHVASEKLAAKARGENDDALVVVDPHVGSHS